MTVEATTERDTEAGREKSGAVRTALLLSPVIVACLLMAAHFMRWGQTGVVLLCVSAPVLLLFRRAWVPIVFTVLLFLAGALWVSTIIEFYHVRVAHNAPWARMAGILGGVAFFTVASSLVFHTRTLRDRYGEMSLHRNASIAAFLVTAGLLIMVQLKTDPAGLLLERFIPYGGWLEAFWLSVYAAFITGIMMEPKDTARWRPRIWALFSVVFFAQLLIGLFGVERFLMTGELHLPVPALIVAGPAYRGEGFFMIILFSVTLLLVGPAWCSYLCYVGAWDDQASRLKKKPGALPAWRGHLRAGILVAALAAAFGLRYLEAPGWAALWLGAGFGIAGVGIMAFMSTRRGAMVHCTAYCPIGFVATRLGKINPMRVKFNDEDNCTDCGACSNRCRYDALRPTDIANRKPGPSCTICGDCINGCPRNILEYSFPGLSPYSSRAFFIVVVISLHAVFLGVARI